MLLTAVIALITLSPRNVGIDPVRTQSSSTTRGSALTLVKVMGKDSSVLHGILGTKGEHVESWGPSAFPGGAHQVYKKSQLPASLTRMGVEAIVSTGHRWDAPPFKIERLELLFGKDVGIEEALAVVGVNGKEWHQVRNKSDEPNPNDNERLPYWRWVAGVKVEGLSPATIRSYTAQIQDKFGNKSETAVIGSRGPGYRALYGQYRDPHAGKHFTNMWTLRFDLLPRTHEDILFRQ